MPAVMLSAYSAVALDHAADVLREGQLIVIPTDTVYGLAAALSRPDAIARIYAVKRRPPDRPIALLVDRITDVEVVATEIPEAARRLMEEFWPGGLTILLPKRPGVPDIVTAGGPTVAVRMPDLPVPRALIRRLGEPLPATSANISGQPSPTTAEQAEAQIGDEVAIILDAGATLDGIDSTIVDPLSSPVRILRVGAVSAEAIEAVLGEPVVIADP